MGGCGARTDGVSDLNQAVGGNGDNKPIVTDGSHWVTTDATTGATQDDVTDGSWQPSPTTQITTPATSVAITDGEPWFPTTSPSSGEDSSPRDGETTTSSDPLAGTPGPIISGGTNAGSFAACSDVGEPVSVSTAEQLEQQLLRRWVYCAGWVLFGIPHDGIEFRSDGTWAFLQYDGEGELQAQKGFDGGGDWKFGLVESGGAMIELTMIGGDSLYLNFQDGPSGMHVSSTGGATAYIAADEVGDEEAPTVAVADAGTEIVIEGCGEQGDVVTVATQAELEARLVGSWLLCSGNTPGGVRHDGIEFHADGTWAFLDYDADGELALQSSPGTSGIWEVSWPESLQVTIEWGEAAEYLHFGFQDNPSAMRMQQTIGYADYVKVE